MRNRLSFNNGPLRILILTLTFIPITLFAQDYFEGELHYKISYEAINKNISPEYLALEFGDSFTAYVKEDRYAMVHHGKGTLGWMKIIVRLDEGFTYLEYQNLDTITKSEFTQEDGRLLEFKRNLKEQKNVMGELCESITVKYVPKDEIPLTQEVRGTYYFSPNYRLNPKKYKGYGDGFWNKYVDESGSISIRNETEYYPLFSSVSEAVSIEKKEIPYDVFEPNARKVIKEK